MNKKQEKQIKQSLESEMHKLSVKSVGEGYKACAKEIKDKIDKGGTIEDVIKHCDWVLGSSDKVVEVVNKNK